MIFPGSTLFGKNASWIVAAEMVRTSRLFARMAARIDPGWLEALGGDAVPLDLRDAALGQGPGPGRRRREGDALRPGDRLRADRALRPDRSGGGPPDLRPRRRSSKGEVKEPFDFLRATSRSRPGCGPSRKSSAGATSWPNRQILDAFYAERLPGIFDIRGLKDRMQPRGGDDFLRMSEADPVRVLPDPAELALFPDEISAGGRTYPAVYKFAPGEDDDGVTLNVPLGEVARLSAEPSNGASPAICPRESPRS